MDLIDKLTELASRIQRQKDSALTEEAAKTAFVLPFIQSLGYDVFNPSEVIPEYTTDHGVKKGEKVDYAIKQDSVITIIIECKPIGADLEAKYAGQLFRYFSVTDARFGVLTDGVRYIFFSDLEKANRMDDRPFFEFNLFDFNEGHVEELKKFTKSSFDLDTIVSTASNLKFHKALLAEIRTEFEHPSEDLVKLLSNRVYSGRLTQKVIEQFTDLTQQAMRDYLRDRINVRLQSALNHQTDVEDTNPALDALPIEEEIQISDSDIETTPEEMEAHRIIQAIGSELVDPERIVMRDAKSYCAILLDDNNRRPICRLFFGKNRMSLEIFVPDNRDRIDIEKVMNIHQHRNLVLDAIRHYDK